MGRSRRARPLAKRSAPAHFEPAAYALQGPVSPRGLAGQGTAMCHWFPHVDRLHVCYRRYGAIGTTAAAAFGPLFVPQRGSGQGLGGREDRDIVHFFNINPAELRRRGAGTSVIGTAAGSSRNHLDASSVRDRPVREIVVHVK